jgi:hypothetical protein
MKIGFFILKVGPQLSESQSAEEVSSVIFLKKKNETFAQLNKNKRASSAQT